jgi:hypothetical protein
MNWGYRIVVVYIAFVLGIGYLVYRTSQESVDLVSDKYYEKGVQYQDQIDREANVKNSHLNLQAVYNKTAGTYTIQFPKGAKGKSIDGNIHFFRPDNSHLDFTVNANPDTNLIQQISTAKLTKGLWRVQTTWKSGDKPLYQEEKVFIH